MISIIMPVKNAGRYFAATMDSLVTQTFADFECLIIDDHSNDGAIENVISSPILENDSRFSVLENNGLGIIDALNMGLSAAKRPFIARMDGDDLAQPKRLEVQLDYMQRHPEIGICGAQIDYFNDDNSIQQGLRHYQQWLNQQTSHNAIVNNLYVECALPHPTFFIRQEVFDSITGYEDHGWPEDYDLLLRAHAAGFQFGKPEEVLLHWRDHSKRLSRNDQRYQKEKFFAAKAHYFAKSSLSKKPLVIWGAGKTGCLLHDELAKNGVSIEAFLDVSSKVIGGEKRGLAVLDAMQYEPSEQLILIAVSSRGVRQKIVDHLEGLGSIAMQDYVAMA